MLLTPILLVIKSSYHIEMIRKMDTTGVCLRVFIDVLQYIGCVCVCVFRFRFCRRCRVPVIW